MPEEIKKEIFELSRLNVVDLDKLAKIKAAKALEKAAENESGTAGAGMGMGMGFAMANQMGQTFGNQQQQTQKQEESKQVPPPIPQAIVFHVVVDGQPSGPFTAAILKQMITQNQITKETLVWREGMGSWVAASQIPEINALFGSVPPPIPPSL